MHFFDEPIQSVQRIYCDIIVMIIIKQKEMIQADKQIKKQQQPDEPLFSSADKRTLSKKQQKKSKPRKIIRPNAQQYHWKHKENKKYLQFIIFSRSLFDLSLQEKRWIGINKLMSDYIKTRDSVQCHSHHQKMLKKYGSIDEAIVQMTKIYSKKSRLIRKKIQYPVKIEQTSFYHHKQDECGLKFVKTQKQAHKSKEDSKVQSQLVKTEQISA